MAATLDINSSRIAALRLCAAASGLTVSVSPFRLGGFSAAGGSITLVANGIWFVGVDLFTGAVIALPRLGHRGWVPVARVVTGAASVTAVEQIAPVLPASRIPRTLRKIRAGQAISVVVMGSSLTQGGNTTDWPGMLFNATSSLSAYRIPGTVSAQYRGVGSSPNQYQLAQLGFASGHTAGGYIDSGYPKAFALKGPVNGRSNLFSGVDLVVLGCLANGGDYRLETIEPLIRKLRQAGVEVIVTTDNPQIATPWAQPYSALTAAGLYVDGPEVARIADLYGIEFADTAAYVLEATMRYPTNGAIYGVGETIHMANAAPAGHTAAPSGGHEVWARAIRSLIPLDPVVKFGPFDFSDGTIQGWYAIGSATVAVTGGELVATVTATQGGVAYPIGAQTGDTVRVYGKLDGTTLYSVNLSIGGISPAYTNVSSAFDLTFTASAAGDLYIRSNQASGQIIIDNLRVEITRASGATDIIPGRAVESRPLPPIRVVSDFKTPADAFVILPADEQMLVSGGATKGTLGAHPWGAGSFARCWSVVTGATSDLLTLTVGKEAYLSAHCVVGLALIRYQDQADLACTFDVSRNGTVFKTVNLGTVPFANEWFTSIATPTEYNQTAAAGIGDSIKITVTTGTLKIAALIAMTADIDYLPPEQISFVGAWLGREQEAGTGMWGQASDTAGDYAMARCTGRRLQWLLANRSNSQPVDFYSDREQTLAQAQTGANHVRARGGLLGPGAMHSIRLTSAAASPVAGNRSLHIGGAIIINDR